MNPRSTAIQHRLPAILVAIAVLGAGVTAGFAQDEDDGWETSGMTALEMRGFADQPAYPGQGEGGQGSLIVSPEFDRQSTDGRDQFRIAPFLRVDGTDAERTHFDVREAYWRRLWNDWDLTVGFNRVFWGVTESRHLVDVINQTDLVEDIDGEEKLGQPMIQLVTDRSWGRLEAFALLGFRERTHPGAEGRLRGPFPVDRDAAVYESGAGRTRVDGAIRWSHYLGDWDLGAYWFHGTGREPRLILDPAGRRSIPYYEVIDQIGLDAQFTHGAWLWKLETIARSGQGSTFGAAVAGFEYTLYRLGRSSADLGLLAEYLYDGRDPTAPWTAFEDDVFVGARFALNDPYDTQLLGGVVVDRNDGSTVLSLEAERRVGARVKLEFEARWFVDVAPTNSLVFIGNDSHVTLRVSRFF